MKYLNCLLFVFCIFNSCNNDVLLDEYKLLYTDIENINTYGYKSYFNHEKQMAFFEINNDQGSLAFTEINTDCAIIGQGFFKVKLDDGFGYTRNGNFVVNGYGELLLLSRYSLSEPVYIPEYFLPDTLTIKENGDILVSVPKSKGELDEVYAGQLKIYQIQTNSLKHYQDGIYKLKAEADGEKIITDSKIIHKFVELSNFNALAVLLRMYYILSNLNEKTIPNIEYKKEILKILIDKTTEGKWYTDIFIPFLKYDY